MSLYLAKLMSKNDNLLIELVPPGQNYIEVQSSTNPEVKYRVDLTRLSCNCPAYTYRKRNGHRVCKHILSLGYTEAVVLDVHKRLGRRKPVYKDSVVITKAERQNYTDLL